MNSTSSQIPYETAAGGVLSRDEYVTISHALAYAMLFSSSAGVVTNSINIKTFVSMGLEDGITVCLWGLSISDLGLAFFGCIRSSANIIAVIEVTYYYGLENNLPIHPQFFSGFSINIAMMFFEVSTLITTFMAVARCMCVAMPFQFKHYFTRSKSVFAMVSFVIVALLSYLPVLSLMGAETKFDPIVNKTRIVLWHSSKRSDVKDVVLFIHLVGMIFFSTFVVIVCVAIMAIYLQESVKFRHNNSTSVARESNSKEMSDPKLSGKELQIVRQVLAICIIYTICMLPALFVAIYRLADEDFDVGRRRLAYIYYISGDTVFVFSLVNSATSFLVYYEFNSKFRSCCSFGRQNTKLALSE